MSLNSSTIKDKNYLCKNLSFKSFNSDINLHGKIFYPKKYTYKKLIHLQLFHGAIDYHGRYQQIIDFLFRKFPYQIVISTFDYLGHGYSGGHRAFIPKFEVFCEDTIKFHHVLKESFFDELDKCFKHFILAHSMGGLISLKTLLEYEKELVFKYSGLILSNPCIRPKIRVPRDVMGIMQATQDTFGKLRLPLIYDSTDLCSDHFMANQFESDVLISKFITYRLGWEVHQASRSIRSLSYYMKIPTLFMISGDDRVVDSNATEIFAKGMPKDLVEVKKYKNCRHELLCEVNRDQVYADMTYWLYNVFLKD